MLEIKNISKQFDQHKVVDTVSLKISQGELFVLLGPSGCGKTTLLRLIGGLETPDTGEIYLAGERIDQKSPHQRSIHTVFQNYALFPHLNVFENIAFGPRVQNISKNKINDLVIEALDTVRMAKFAKKMPNQLSGGERQRVALARALINRPQILLLDEPLSALDQKLRVEMQKELVSLQRQLKITFIFVTHDQEEAMGMSDRICIMNSGKIQQIGSGEDLYRKPNNYFVTDFFGHSNSFNIRMQSETDRHLKLVLLEHRNLVLEVQKSLVIQDQPNRAEYQFLIRPESLKINLAKSETCGQLPVTLRKLLFKGPMTEILCTIQSSNESASIVLVTAPSNEIQGLTEGQSAFLELKSNAWLFAKDLLL
jgi:spermidine/putrescine transport system ATP-binding protein